MANEGRWTDNEQPLTAAEGRTVLSMLEQAEVAIVARLLPSQGFEVRGGGAAGAGAGAERGEAEAGAGEEVNISRRGRGRFGNRSLFFVCFAGLSS